jgi:uncharacterized protein YbaR (Trm112 family)
MKPRLMDLIVCPLDGRELELVEWESVPVVLSDDELRQITAIGLDPPAFSREIVTGALVNRRRRLFYPIYRGVPRLLTCATGVAREFARTHAARVAYELPGLTLPEEVPPPGEMDILRSFSNEWLSYDWNPNAYWNLNPDDMYRSMRSLMDLDRKPLRHKLVLEMGIGIGGIADYVSRSEECELVVVDLGYSVDAARNHFGHNPLLHIVQASVFAPPFRHNSFDFVYSHGAPTYFTKAAFDYLASLPKEGGRLYIWVYGPYDYGRDRNWPHRILMKMEQIMRPIVWRAPDRLQTLLLAPIVALYLGYENVSLRNHNGMYIKYGWREAMHAARDRFTPRYAHRHDVEEVSGWFRQAGYKALQCAGERPRPDFLPVWLVRHTAVHAVRA